MLITLNNQRTVSIPFEQWIDMNDYELRIFMDSEYGEEINDPFYQSQIGKRIKDSDPDEDMEE